jgi:hypothetical protein
VKVVTAQGREGYHLVSPMYYNCMNMYTIDVESKKNRSTGVGENRVDGLRHTYTSHWSLVTYNITMAINSVVNLEVSEHIRIRWHRNSG